MEKIFSYVRGELMNDENLIQNKPTTPSQRRESARKAGIASAEARKAKKTMRETLQELLSLPLGKGDIEVITNFADAKGKNLSAEQAMCIAMIKEALKGNVKAATFVRDTSGNKLTDDVNVNVVNAVPDLSSFSADELRKMAGIDNGESDK